MILQGTTAVITGGGSGMGAGAAEVLAEQGLHACLLGRRKAVLEATASRLGASAYPCDVSDPESLESVFDSIGEQWGAPRILVHAAAIGHMLPLLAGRGQASSKAALREIIDINVLGTLYTNQAFAERLSRAEPLESGLARSDHQRLFHRRARRHCRCQLRGLEGCSKRALPEPGPGAEQLRDSRDDHRPLGVSIRRCSAAAPMRPPTN